MTRLTALICALAVFATGACTTTPDTPTTPESVEASSILFWPKAVQIDGYRTIADRFPTRTIAASNKPLPLPAAADPLDARDLSWQADGKTTTLEDWLLADRIVGAIVVQRGEVLHESYRFGNTAKSRWISFSVAKSVTAMLIGAAVRDGFINSVDDPVTNYLPRLQTSGYAKASVRDVLQMASGVAWDENYFDPTSDVSNAGGLNGTALIDYMSRLKSVSTPGSTFNYSTGETNLAGELLRAAIGKSASEYLEEKIWQPFGMEHDAYWLLDAPDSGELGGCCLNATLRDYARIGLFAMNDGMLSDNAAVLADHWMRDSVAPSQGYPGYGYFWWLNDDGTYSALGIFGQLIHIDPERELVIAMHGAWEKAVGEDLGQRRRRAVQAISTALDKRDV